MAIESQLPEKKRILVVEDEMSTRTMLVKLLESVGYEVFQEERGDTGLDRVYDLRPDLLLLDLNLPNLTGTEICAKLKSDPRVRDIPILMMTGEFKSPEDKIKGFGLGADDYITKPFDLSILLSRIQNLFKAQRPLE